MSSRAIEDARKVRQWIRGKLAYPFCWLAILLIAGALRIPPIYANLPYIDYIDEGYVLHQAIDLLNHPSWDTRWYGYPSLPAYLTVATMVAYSPFYRLTHRVGFWQELPDEKDLHTLRGDNYDLITPSALIAAGRWVTVCLSIGTVVLAGLLALRIAGEEAALVTMVLTAMCPALVSRASNVIVDTFATFFGLLSIYFADLLHRRHLLNDKAMRRAAILAGASAGLAFASKYTVAAVFAGLTLTIVLLPHKWSFRGWLLVNALAGALVAGALAAPAAILKPMSVLKELSITAHSYSVMNTAPGYLGSALSLSELGWPIILAGGIGLVLMLRSPEMRPFSLSWMLFAVCLVGLFATKPFQPFRNLIPLLPGLFVAAATAFVLTWRRMEGTRYQIAGRFAVVCFAAIIALLFFRSSAETLQARLRHRDARLQAIDWLRTHAGKNDKVLALAELGFLPREWDRVPGHVRVVSVLAALDLLRRQHFDYVVSGEFERRPALDDPLLSQRALAWQVALTDAPCRARYGEVATPLVPYLWRTNDELICLLVAPQLKAALD